MVLLSANPVPRLVLALSALTIAFAAVGCTASSPLPTLAAPAPSLAPTQALATPAGTGSSSHPLDYTELLGALRSAGVQVEPDAEVDQPFFDVEGRVVKVNGHDVQVFEFDDAAQMEAAAAAITPSGDSATTMITWVGPPHFYKKGQLVVLYVGDDKNVKDVLQSILGPQFAGK